MRELVCHVLEAQGYCVSVARDGQELSAAITDAMCGERVEIPDLLISDVQMPKISGLSVLERLRQDGCQIPVLMITAFPDQQTRRKVQRLDASLLSKPFAVQDLLTKTRQLLQPQIQAAQATG